MKFYSKISYRPSAYVLKFLFVMKLCIVLMTTVFLQISLAAEAQKITLSEKNTSLENIFKKIRVQTGYDFFCDIELLKTAKKVNIDVKNVDLEEALNQCLLNQNLTYVVSDKIIVIKKKQGLISDQAKKVRIDFTLSGKIVNERGAPLPGATLTIKGTKKSFTTNEKGEYNIRIERTDVLIVSYIGYETKEIKLNEVRSDIPLIITLRTDTGELQEVQVVSTGYQELPKERATGSFQVITAKQLMHSTDPNLLKRLEGITTGLDFNNSNILYPTNSSKFKAPPLAGLTIRGKNNLQALISTDPKQSSGQPLVVIDGIASPYSIDKINPNDVESINILQDAASASIWGSRAANGVIVVKTKKGQYQSPMTISFNSAMNITDRINLSYKKRMSTSDFIDAQLAQLNYNFEQGSPPIDDPNIFDPQAILSPVAEIWNSWKLGRLQLDEYTAQIDALRNNDIRDDLSKYFFRKAIIQSYSLAINGGFDKYAYRLSGGFDKTQNNTIQSDANRISVNYSASVKATKNLDFQAIITYNQQNRNEQGAGTTAITGENIYPYSRLVDASGNPAVVPRGYRPAFLDSLSKAYGNQILDMRFRPLDDIKQGYVKYKSQLMSINLNSSYKISPVFSGNITYSNSWGQNEQQQLRGERSYFMRELINKFTDPTTLTRVVPLGGMYIPSIEKANDQTLRGQINADKTWAEKHVLSAIAGVDVSQTYSNSRDTWFYGYDEKTKTVNNALPFNTEVNTLFLDYFTGNATDIIPYASGFSDFKSRSFSMYSNAAYTYDKRYTLSASLRDDFSSVFGRGTNKTGALYFSVGGAWSINNEKFYHINWLPNLQLRATFGYNGNVNATVSPVPLISYTPISSAGNMLPYASTLDGTNRNLRPEKAAMLNIALSFGTTNNRLSGNIEYYIRNTKDLIYQNSLDPSTGFSILSYNAANLHGRGFDVNLNSINLQQGAFRWTSNLLFSNNRVKVTKLFTDKPLTAGQLVSGNPRFNQGFDLSRIFAYRWAGLDPETGDPMGYVDGVPVRVTGDQSVMSKIFNAPGSTARYFGSSVPVYYGAFRNTFTYGNISISANFLYKFGYYFRRPVSDIVRYANLFNDNMLQAAEYADRWKNPGDEKNTNVPSITFPITPDATATRDLFYQNSEINVLKADHIRLQEINLSYTFKKNNWIIKNPRIYANVNNLGIVWRANKQGIDPDIQDYPQPKTYSFGLSASF